jgi:hypothetical protein
MGIRLRTSQKKRAEMVSENGSDITSARDRSKTEIGARKIRAFTNRQEGSSTSTIWPQKLPNAVRTVFKIRDPFLTLDNEMSVNGRECESPSRIHT